MSKVIIMKIAAKEVAIGMPISQSRIYNKALAVWLAPNAILKPVALRRIPERSDETANPSFTIHQ